MPITIGTGLQGEATKLHGSGSWLWLFEIDIDSSTVAYVTNHDSEVTWDGKTFSPWLIETPTVPESKSVDLGTVEITASDVDQVLSGYLRQGKLIGENVRIVIAHEDQLSETTDYVSRSMVVLGASANSTAGTVTFSVGVYNWASATSGRRFIRNRCQHVYGGTACGYDKDRSGALSTCDRTFADCQAHGDNESDAGLFSAHPQRFGGFPGMPKQNRG